MDDITAMNERRIFYITTPLSAEETKKVIERTMSGIAPVTKTVTNTKLPSLWRVVLHNDDFTPFTFVVQLIQLIFHKPVEEAIELAHRVHFLGSAEAGLFTKEVALTKMSIVIATAEQYGYPLVATATEA